MMARNGDHDDDVLELQQRRRLSSMMMDRVSDTGGKPSKSRCERICERKNDVCSWKKREKNEKTNEKKKREKKKGKGKRKKKKEKEKEKIASPYIFHRGVCTFSPTKEDNSLTNID
ncbi:unnamed protein product [Cuscuta europaea]|uniref:Uncharacterized protein n=1 Tax=Cuscuta europaea TaxID=41803 RepID=A0A9P0Z9Y8_CUSEU|nr:unnamed protein product [Cuscuta europaea]